MKILVTGGLGFIGSHTVVELQNKGFDVVVIDNLSNSNIKVLDGIEKISGIRPNFEQFDLKDKQLVHRFFNKYPDIGGMIHFAASKAVNESLLLPLKYYENNIHTLIYLLQEMKERSLQNFIFSSSCTVYGEPDKLPITEDERIKPALTAYGYTKQAGETIIADASRAHNIKCIALRYFNPIGAHPSAEIGELPLGVPQNLIPFVTQTAAGIREQLSVFGDDYNTPDGTAIRDYIHVVDLAKAHVKAVNRMIESKQKKNVEIFNLGTGNGFSVLEVIKSLERVANVKLNYKIVDRREGDVEAVYADTKFANDELGWKAEKTLDEMMASAWKWEKALANNKK